MLLPYVPTHLLPQNIMQALKLIEKLTLLWLHMNYETDIDKDTVDYVNLIKAS